MHLAVKIARRGVRLQGDGAVLSGLSGYPAVWSAALPGAVAADDKGKAAAGSASKNCQIDHECQMPNVPVLCQALSFLMRLRLRLLLRVHLLHSRHK